MRKHELKWAGFDVAVVFASFTLGWIILSPLAALVAAGFAIVAFVSWCGCISTAPALHVSTTEGEGGLAKLRRAVFNLAIVATMFPAAITFPLGFVNPLFFTLPAYFALLTFLLLSCYWGSDPRRLEAKT